jgi:uncharacterized protein YprB with RNaseH-like and TPR domain
MLKRNSMFDERLRQKLNRWRKQTGSHLSKTERDRELPSGDSRTRERFAGRIDRSHWTATVISAQQAGSQLDRGRELKRDEGTYLFIERPLSEVFPSSPALLSTWQREFRPAEPLRQAIDSAASLTRERNRQVVSAGETHRRVIAQFQSHFPRRALFLDLETCGLAGAAIFLAGLIRYDGDRLMLTQLWARNYAEEAALIGALGEIVQSSRVLVTFNGKSFDWPQVRDRTTRYAAATGTLPELPHFDLLHHSRRRYGRQFGDCRLQTLELHVCGRRRVGDIPGHEIPSVYAEYVRTGNTELVEPILHHNALDLVTLWQLALQLGS